MALLDNLFGLDALRRFAAARDGKVSFDDRFGAWPGVNQPLPPGTGESDPRFGNDLAAASSGSGGGGGGGGGWLGDIASKLGNFYLDSVSPVMDVRKYRKPFSLAPGAGEYDPRFGDDGANFSMASDPRFSNTDLPPSTNDPQSREPQVFENGVPLPRPKPQSGLNGTREVVPGGQDGPGAAAMAQAPMPDQIGDPSESAVPMPATGPGAIPVAQQRVPFSMAPTAGGVPMVAPDGQGDSLAAGGAAAADLGGFGGLFSRLFNPDNAPIWAALGSAAGAGSTGEAIGRASAALGPAMALKRQNEIKSTGIAATYRALVNAGVPPAEAVAATQNPILLKALTEKYFGEPKLQTAGGVVFRRGRDGNIEKVADFTSEKVPVGFERQSDGSLRYIPGGPADPKYKREAGDRQNAPAGYRFRDPSDPNSPLDPIEGGPATKLPTDIAGKLALMNVVRKDIPSARAELLKDRGKTGLGLSGVAASKTNIGEIGRAQRTVRTAIEAALRVMTGAAAPEQEVLRYEQMFMPSPFDAPETANQKLDQLEQFMANADALVTQGRSAHIGAAPAPNAAVPTGPLMAPGETRSIDGITIRRVN